MENILRLGQLAMTIASEGLEPFSTIETHSATLESCMNIFTEWLFTEED